MECVVAWQLQEAKQKFSEVVRRALDEGPQVVTRHGDEVVVVLSVEEYRRITENKRSLRDLLLSGPKLDNDVVDEIFARSKEPARIFEFDQ
jgi:antitoxin Phd